MSQWLYDLTWEDVKEYLERKTTIILPAGSTEQHGPHLPLGTDAMVGIRLAEDAAKQTGILVAPPLWFGWSPQHMAFPGTITVKPANMAGMIEDICMSLLYHGFRKIVIVNGHRIANLPPIQIAASKIVNETAAYVGIVDPIYIGFEVHRELLADPESGGVAHAEGLETGHMLYLHPELVRKDRIPPPVAGGHGLPMNIVSPFSPGDRVIHQGTAAANARGGFKGASGNPSWGTEERGKRLHQAALASMVRYLEMVEGLDVPPIRVSYPA